jgi:hypothetical protein
MITKNITNNQPLIGRDMDFSTISSQEGLIDLEYVNAVIDEELGAMDAIIIFTNASIRFPSVFYPKCFNNYNVINSSDASSLNAQFREKFCKRLDKFTAQKDFFIYQDQFNEFITSPEIRKKIDPASGFSYDLSLKAGLSVALDLTTDAMYIDKLLQVIVDFHIKQCLYPSAYLLSYRPFRHKYLNAFGIEDVGIFEQGLAIKSHVDAIFNPEDIISKECYKKIYSTLVAPSEALKGLQAYCAKVPSKDFDINAFTQALKGISSTYVIEFEASAKYIVVVPEIQKAPNGKDKTIKQKKDSSEEVMIDSIENKILIPIDARYLYNTTRVLLADGEYVDNAPLDRSAQELSGIRDNKIIDIDLSALGEQSYLDLRHDDRCSITATLKAIPTNGTKQTSLTGLPLKSVYFNLNSVLVMHRKPRASFDLPVEAIQVRNNALKQFLKTETSSVNQIASEIFEDDEIPSF